MMSWLRRVGERFFKRPDAVSTLDQVAGLPAWLLLSIGVVAFLSLSAYEMAGQCITNDEICHLPSGYSYLVTGDYRMNPEHPALAKVMAALPLLFLPVRWPVDPRWWDAAQEWDFGYQFMFLSGNDPDRMLFWGRLPMHFWGVILLLSIYAIAREHFGARGGLIALVLAVFQPMLIAHGHLVTTDVPVAAMTLLALVSLDRFCRRPTFWRSLAFGLMFGGALVVKYSAVFLIPAAGLLLVIAAVKARKASKTGEGKSPRSLGAVWRSRLRWAGMICAMTSVPILVIWATYGFTYDRSPELTRTHIWSLSYTQNSLVGRCVGIANQLHLLPEPYLWGFRDMHQGSQGRQAYALGEMSRTGWWWYFPFAFLVKTPLPALVLMGWGLFASVRRHQHGDSSDAFLIVPLIFYWMLVISSRMNIGLRHAMPVYPLMLILAGGVPLERTEPARSSRAHRVVAGLLALSAAGCFLAAPYFLAYFNSGSLLFWKRHEMLADSNLDWGQDLGRLKRYLDKQGISDVKLAYFGNASPRALKLSHQVLTAGHMYTEYEKEWKNARALKPGDVVAISTTTLAGILLKADPTRYQRLVAGLEPIAEIGHSILVYRLPGHDHSKPFMQR